MDRNIGDRKRRSDATGSRHRRWLYSVALLVISGLIFVPAVIYAVHDFDFELDGNTVVDNNTPTPWDWNSIFDVGTANGVTNVGVPHDPLPSGALGKFTAAG